MSLQEQIIGVWELVSYHVEDSEGSKTYPLGTDCSGFIMYHPEGYMSAQMMAQERPVYESGSVHVGSTEEMAAAAKGYLAYAGPYEVDDTESKLIHHMHVSLNPTWLHNVQPRYIKIEDDFLTIASPPIVYERKKQNTTIVWRRI